MTDGKSTWGDTVLGWFVVRDKEQDSTPPSPDMPSVEPVGELPAAPGGVVDFDGVFTAFGIAPEARDRLAKGDGLLRSLPVDTDPAIKRQIVEASLRAFNVPIEQIIETACEEVQALSAYQQNGDTALQAFCAEANRRIGKLEQEILATRKAMEKEVEDQKKTVEACNQRKLEIQGILEFFGAEAVGRVVRDSPKLIDPRAPGTTGGAKRK